MLIIIILIVMAMMMPVTYILDKKVSKGDYRKLRKTINGLLIIGLLGAVSLIISLIAVFAVQTRTEIDTITTQHRQEELNYRLNRFKDGYEDEHLLSELIEWNDEVIAYKYFAENPWTSWFFNKKVADVESVIDFMNE